MKNPQFLSNLAHTLLILPTSELVIFTKFHENWSKIEDFSLMAYFQASLIFFGTVSTVPKKMELALKYAINEKSTIFFQFL